MINNRIKNRAFGVLLAMVTLLVLPLSAQASVWQDVKEEALQGWERTKEVVASEENKESVKGVWGSVKNAGLSAWEATKEGAGIASDKVVEVSKDGYEKAKELTE